MRKNLLDMTQPFGVVNQHSPMGSGSNAFGSKNSITASKTEVPNHHRDHSVPGHGDQSAAISHAHAHRENEFFWTGHPQSGG